jgi:hypothetical protein
MNMQWWSCLKEGNVGEPEGVRILDFDKNWSTLSSGISHDRPLAMVEQPERHSG